MPRFRFRSTSWATVSVSVSVLNSWPAASSSARSSAWFSMMPLCTSDTRAVPGGGAVLSAGGPVGGPAGVADTNCAGQGGAVEGGGEIGQLALGPAPVDVAVYEGGDPGTV